MQLKLTLEAEDSLDNSHEGADVHEDAGRLWNLSDLESRLNLPEAL